MIAQKERQHPSRSRSTNFRARSGTSADALARLKPAFRKEGTVTAGNASGINDGAAAVVVASEDRVRLMELAPIAEIISYGLGRS